MFGTTWMPDEPLPTIAILLPSSFTSLFHRLECHCTPLNLSRPGTRGIIGLFKAPVAAMRMSAVTVKVSPEERRRKVIVWDWVEASQRDETNSVRKTKRSTRWCRATMRFWRCSGSVRSSQP